jgi:hypothetical protein
VRAQLVAHRPLNTNGAALPIETGAELQIGPILNGTYEPAAVPVILENVCLATPAPHYDAGVQEANARLIAAALDLLQALEACKRRRSRAEGDNRSSAKWCGSIRDDPAARRPEATP